MTVDSENREILLSVTRIKIQFPGAPPPPIHAINRGIGMEGLGTMLAGLWGSGNGTNTFGENVGTIGEQRRKRSDFQLYDNIPLPNNVLSSEPI